MNSLWANPWMLLALLGVAIPVIIEIIFRRRRREVDLPTIRFLLKNPEEQKIKRQDRLLLILRCCVPALVALAVARPQLTPDLLGGARKRHAAILIDSTLSMGQQAGVSTAFLLAKKEAANLVRSLPPGSLVSVITLGRDARMELARSADLYAAGEFFEGLKITHGAAPFAAALNLLDEFTKADANAHAGESLEVYCV